MFKSMGFDAAAISGQRASSCEYYLNKSGESPTASAPQAYAYVFVDPQEHVLDQGQTRFDGIGLNEFKPAKAGDPCSYDLLTERLDIGVEIDEGSTVLSATVLCGLAHLGVARTADVLHGRVRLVGRDVSTNSLAYQDVCQAVSSTTSYVALSAASSYEFGFGTTCRYNAKDFTWWIEVRFGVLPSDQPSVDQTSEGHTFQAYLDAPNGYCRFRWQGPAIPGTSTHEQVTVFRQSEDAVGKGQSCFPVGTLAGQLITALGRH